MSVDEAAFADLARRVRVLEDELAIRAVLDNYAHYIDYGLNEEWVDLFTEDAIYDRGPRPKPGKYLLQGHADLMAFCSGHSHVPEVRQKHVTASPVITVDGDKATVRAYFVRFDEHDGELFIYAFGRYQDRLVRCADGRWRFKERHIEREAFTTNVPTP